MFILKDLINKCIGKWLGLCIEWEKLPCLICNIHVNTNVLKILFFKKKPLVVRSVVVYDII